MANSIKPYFSTSGERTSNRNGGSAAAEPQLIHNMLVIEIAMSGEL